MVGCKRRGLTIGSLPDRLDSGAQMTCDIADEVILLSWLTRQSLLPEDASLVVIGGHDLRLEIFNSAEPVFLIRLGILRCDAVLEEGRWEVVGRSAKIVTERGHAVTVDGVEGMFRSIDRQLDEVSPQAMALGVSVSEGTGLEDCYRVSLMGHV